MILEADPIKELYDDFNYLIQLLDRDGQASSRSFADGNFRKVLLLAAASYFEKRLTDCIGQFTRDEVGEEHILVAIVDSKVVERQYHTWFDWKANNINRFLRMFGVAFADRMKYIIRSNEDLADGIEDFIEIGRERNRLVHQNFVNYRMEKTSKEIYQTYVGARRFIEWFPEVLRNYGSRLGGLGAGLDGGT